MIWINFKKRGKNDSFISFQCSTLSPDTVYVPRRLVIYITLCTIQNRKKHKYQLTECKFPGFVINNGYIKLTKAIYMHILTPMGSNNWVFAKHKNKHVTLCPWNKSKVWKIGESGCRPASVLILIRCQRKPQTSPVTWGAVRIIFLEATPGSRFSNNPVNLLLFHHWKLSVTCEHTFPPCSSGVYLLLSPPPSLSRSFSFTPPLFFPSHDQGHIHTKHKLTL